MKMKDTPGAIAKFEINQEVKRKYNNCCVRCSQSAKNVFKVFPKALGGEHTIENLILLCGNCLHKEHALQQEQYPILTDPKAIKNYKETGSKSIKPIQQQIPLQINECKRKIKSDIKEEIELPQVYTDTETGITLTDHAYKRVNKRSPIGNCDAPIAMKYCLDIMRKGEHIGKVLDDNGNVSDVYLFKEEKVCVRDNEIVTYIKECKNPPYEPIRMKLLRTYKAELNRLKRLSYSRERFLENLKHESEVEISLMKLKIHRARSESTKLACQARINAIQISIKEYEMELLEIYKNKNRVSNLVISAS